MKKSYIYTLLLAVGVMLGITACSSDNDWQPGSVTGQQVFFPNTLSSVIELDQTTNTYDITIQRYVADEATTVNLELTDTSSIFSIPSSVAFAAGQKEATITMTYDPSKFSYEKKYGASIKIADANLTTPYGITSYDFAAVIPTPLRLLGTGKWEDSYMFGGSVDAKIYQNTLNENIYRIMLDYPTIVKEAGETPSGLKSDYVDVTVLQVGDELAGTAITKPGQLYFTSFDMSYANSTGEMVAYHPVDFGWTSEGYIGTSYIDAYQDNGLPGTMVLSGLILVDFEGGRGWAPCNSDEAIAVITFPGFTPADYSAELEFAGIFTNPANEVFAVGNLTLGADATDAKAVVVPGDADASAVADAIAAGDLEAASVESGRIEVAIPEGMTGKLQLIVVVIANGAVKNVVNAEFEYYGGGANPWQSIGTGYLTDNMVVTMFGPDEETAFDPQTYEVEIMENNDQPGLYRIVNAFEGAIEFIGGSYTPADIEVNATVADGVYIEAQQVGIGSYAFATYGGYMLQNYDFETLHEYGYFGVNDNGVITFPIFPKKDDDGNVQYTYQGIFFAGSSGYYTGYDATAETQFKIVLPTAASSVKANAKKRAMATDFANRLKGCFVKSNNVVTRDKAETFKLKAKMRKSEKVKKIF